MYIVLELVSCPVIDFGYLRNDICCSGGGNVCTGVEDDFPLTFGSKERYVSRSSHGAPPTAA